MARPLYTSHPASSKKLISGPLAQLVEQETLNLKVEGSNPSRPMRVIPGISPEMAMADVDE